MATSPLWSLHNEPLGTRGNMSIRVTGHTKLSQTDLPPWLWHPFILPSSFYGERCYGIHLYTWHLCETTHQGTSQSRVCQTEPAHTQSSSCTWTVLSSDNTSVTTLLPWKCCTIYQLHIQSEQQTQVFTITCDSHKVKPQRSTLPRQIIKTN